MTLNHIKFRIWVPMGYTPERCSEYCQLCALHDKLTALRILAANLAVGAALTESFVLGEMYGLRGTRSAREARAQWCPNIKGKPAPGSEGGK
jgi:hypothetical protein